MAETVVKTKIGELEEEVRSGCLISMSKGLTGVVQGFSRREEIIG